MPLISLLARMPLAMLYGVANVVYLILYYGVRYRRETVRSNLRAAFPHQPPQALIKLERDFYRHLADLVVEVIAAAHLPPDAFSERVKIKNPELLEELKSKQQPALLLTLHQGNWEWMLHAITLQTGVKLDCIYKPLHNRNHDRFIHEVRSRFGASLLPMRTSTREWLKRRREFRVLAMVADQSPTRKERAYWTEFLNRPAAFFEGAETIALLTSNPVYLARMQRTDRGYYEVCFELLASPPYEREDPGITRAYVAACERAIHAQPQTWLWSNRRWKRSPDA